MGFIRNTAAGLLHRARKKSAAKGCGSFTPGRDAVFEKDTLARTEDSAIFSTGSGFVAKRGCTFTACAGSWLDIGNNVYFNVNCNVCSRKYIKIGDGCIFGPNVCIYDHNHVYDGSGVKPNEYKTAPIEIGRGCWIGANAVILKGVHIGDGSVIGAGCVINRSIPAGSIVTLAENAIRIRERAETQ